MGKLSGGGGGGGGGRGRDWAQIYAIYGVEDWQTPLFLFIHALAFFALALLFLLYFHPICVFLHYHRLFPGPASARFAAAFAGSVTALSAACLLLAAAALLYSALPLRWEMSQRMVSLVPDWSAVRHALDLGGAGGGILLNAVALQLKKSGSSGRVVGIIPGGSEGPARTLRTAGMEGVQKYVTCRAGDAAAVPFGDGSFDVVVSAAFVGGGAAADERMRAVGEAVRVLRPGGIGVVWEVGQAAAEWARRLAELRMEEVRVSERVTAFMAATHVVSFRKPREQCTGGGNEARARAEC